MLAFECFSVCKMPVRMWRITEAEPYGCSMWFDPANEVPALEPLAEGDRSAYVDSPVSVSAVRHTDRTGEYMDVGGPERVLIQLPLFSEEG